MILFSKLFILARYILFSSSLINVNELMGSSATSIVLKGKDNNLDREIAIKVIGKISDSDSKTENFIREARISASLDHPGILPVYDIGQNDQGDVYFTMRKVDGESLGDLIRKSGEGKAAVQIATDFDKINIILRIGEAISFAHNKNFYHHNNIVHYFLGPL